LARGERVNRSMVKRTPDLTASQYSLAEDAHFFLEKVE